jgi:hypothetical protein
MIKHSLLVLLVLVYSCTAQQKKEEKQLTNTKVQEMPDKKEIVYGISVQIDMPFELYFNDIAIAKEYSKARKIMGIDLNPYLLQNGKYNLKVKLLPIEENDTLIVRPSDVKTSFLKLVRYELQRKPNMGRAKNYTVLQELPLPQITDPVPLLEYEWEIEITELPYTLKGWSHSQDLRTIDKEVLEKEVVAYYQYLRKLLNDGDTSTYEKLKQKRYEETKIFNYTTVSDMEKTKKKSIESILKKSKGNMWPIENYKLCIYGNGRLVKLERIDGENKGWNALIRETENGTITSIGVVLYKPIGSDTFEIIRK